MTFFFLNTIRIAANALKRVRRLTCNTDDNDLADILLLVDSLEEGAGVVERELTNTPKKRDFLFLEGDSGGISPSILPPVQVPCKVRNLNPMKK